MLEAGRSVVGSCDKVSDKAYHIDSDCAVLFCLAWASPRLDTALETNLFHLFVAAGAKANVQAVDNLGNRRSALQEAVKNERFELVQLLLAEGANVNVWLKYHNGVFGDNAMMCAWSVPMVHLLLGAGASPDDVPWRLCPHTFTIEAFTAIANGGWRRRCPAIHWWFFIHV